jgi:hypothetical protein
MASSLVLRSLVRVAGVAALGVAVAPGEAAGAGALAVGAVVDGATPVGAVAAAAAVLLRLPRRAVAVAVGVEVVGVAVVGMEVVGVEVVGNLWTKKAGCRRRRSCVSSSQGSLKSFGHTLARMAVFTISTTRPLACSSIARSR